jgi:magnesium-transporting ATPase (P-type)
VTGDKAFYAGGTDAKCVKHWTNLEAGSVVLRFSPQARRRNPVDCRARRRAEVKAEHVVLSDLSRAKAKVIDSSGSDPSTGLTEAEVQERLQRYGYNEVLEKKKNPLVSFLRKFWGLSTRFR